MEKEQIDMKEIKKLALKFRPDEIDICIDQQLKEGSNVCGISGSNDYVINELAKAEFVGQMVNEGVSLIDAVRELARRIRIFHQLNK